MKRIFRRISAVILSLPLLISSASALSVEEALSLLEATYVYDIPGQAQQAETLDELFTLLGDPYTYYMTAEEYQSFLGSVEGNQELVGIGVSIQCTQAGLLIVDVLGGGSAAQAGLSAGDLIVAIDGVSCVPANNGHLALIAGQEGTTVTVTVLQDGVLRNFVLTRRKIVLTNTEVSLLENGAGYIACTSFGSDTDTLFTGGITPYRHRAGCWIVDLRANPGGYADTAVAALGAFAGPGEFLYMRDKQEYTIYYPHYDDALTDAPVIVLVDGGSASASEIFASGIRDAGRGITVGTRTYGKGVAQIILDETTHPALFDGDSLKVTAYRFYSQSGNTTDLIGVIPTLLVNDEDAEGVARALSGSAHPLSFTDGQLKLYIAGQYFYVDLDSIHPDTASALLSALPPSARLWVGGDIFNWHAITVDEAAELLSATYIPRGFSDVSGSPYATEINTLATYGLLRGDSAGNFLPDTQLTRAEGCAMLAQLLDLTYTGASPFTDVDDSAWYADEVNALAELGLVEGVGGGNFRPDAVLSQQEFFTILGRVACYLNFYVDEFSSNLYLDDGSSLLTGFAGLDGFAPWAKESTAVLLSSSYALDKTGSMLFAPLSELSPTVPILREEAAACLYRMLNITGILPV